MNCNTKLEAITDRTLIVGIDVAKKTHVARFIDDRGVELGECMRFENTRKGFCSFKKTIEGVKFLHRKETVIIGVEPTGVYGNTLIAYLQGEGIHVVNVHGMQVKRIKELEDNSPSKNDFKDAKVIASVVKNGYYHILRNFPEDVLELKEATRHAYQITKKLTRVKCQIDTFLTQYFPEFSDAFKDITKKTAMATLHLFPLPGQICELTAEQITIAWRRYGVIKGIGLKKANELKHLAKQTIGLKETESTRAHFISLISEYDFLTGQERTIWKRIEVLLKPNADFKALMTIPHMSLKMAANLLAEVGNFRDFSHPQQIVRLAGFNLKECSSGKNRGLSEITKRGRPMLRRVLYFIVLEQLKRGAPVWQILHKRYTTRKENPLKKMQSIIALCCKFIRVVWGMIKNGTPYNPDMIVAPKILFPNAA